MAEKVRFYKDVKGNLLDAGVPITTLDLSRHIERQEKAVEHNTSQGPMGEMANKLLQPEIEQARKLLEEITKKKL